jgi:hypothetical protein
LSTFGIAAFGCCSSRASVLVLWRWIRMKAPAAITRTTKITTVSQKAAVLFGPWPAEWAGDPFRDLALEECEA